MPPFRSRQPWVLHRPEVFLFSLLASALTCLTLSTAPMPAGYPAWMGQEATRLDPTILEKRQAELESLPATERLARIEAALAKDPALAIYPPAKHCNKRSTSSRLNRNNHGLRIDSAPTDPV